ncbi:MAG: tryptophan--tRNA ligase [Candidatus Tectomicrobia bacterium]|uniref:Tryptophan--tRNA ligase n=1 Tax=Tectimicrobiota bacterium TaxID=2528274 RepID=A0A933LPC6_UNCTE|nr:tryptophan--tRNA ligase [Candidatus Tectomicrobia bacterium]
MKEVVLSGMRPSGKLHLGNWLGALKNWIEMQDEYQCYYFIADWHALTTDYADTSEIRQNSLEIAIDWLAAGLDPEKCVPFIQSQMLEHAELHLLLSMVVPVPWLERVPSYKEQQEQIKNKDLTTYGFLGYPVLQAADILMYKANWVPVGIDQLPHIELTREIARRFNNLYKVQVFPEPKGKINEAAKIPGTDGRKMSKSYNNAIYLDDTPEQVWEKLRTMVTDPARVRRADPGNPEICPVFWLHKIFSPEEVIADIDKGCRTAAIGCVDCKRVLFTHLMKKLEPISSKRKELSKKPDLVREILMEGTKKAREVARRTMAEVREAMKI